MARLNLFLTFDYELPLGGWDVPPEDALIKPTHTILALCDKLHISVVFFVDALSFIRFRSLKNNAFENMVRKQLLEIVQRGHDIQLHLHPHWFTSQLDNEMYNPSNDFKLADFSEREITDMVVQSIDYLNEIAKQVNPAYRCLAFRAGGFNLENSPLIFRVLSQNGIVIDSSMCHDYYFVSDISKVDYRHLPNRSNWFFQDGKFREPTSSGIYEIPIAGKNKSIFEIPTFVKSKLYKNRTPENRGKMIHRDYRLPFREKIRKAMSSRMLSFDNFTCSSRYLLKILQYNVKKFRNREEINLSIIGHPKAMDWYNFKLMEDFVAAVRKLYGNQVEFTVFQEFAKK